MKILQAVFLLMLMAGVAPAASLSYDALPEPVRKTLEAEIGKGKVVNIDSFLWGKTTIYQFQVEVEGKPAMDLQIAETGKLIREDSIDRTDPTDQSE